MNTPRSKQGFAENRSPRLVEKTEETIVLLFRFFVTFVTMKLQHCQKDEKRVE